MGTNCAEDEEDAEASAAIALTAAFGDIAEMRTLVDDNGVARMPDSLLSTAEPVASDDEFTSALSSASATTSAEVPIDR